MNGETNRVTGVWKAAADEHGSCGCVADVFNVVCEGKGCDFVS